MKSRVKISPPFAILGAVLVGILLVSLFDHTAQAQPSSGLTPPFQFVKQSQRQPSGAGLVPPGSTSIMTETFDASFAPTTTLSGSTAAWRVFVNPDDTAGYYWDRVRNTSPVAFTHSAWTAAKPISALTAGVSPYPAGQDTWLIFGPIDLSRYMYAQVSLEYYLDAAAGDELSWGYSTDGHVFYGNSQSARSAQWISDSISFPLNWMNGSNSTVYLAFTFKSGSSVTSQLGAFVRNVRLTAEPVKYVYLPIISRQPTPTPTSTPTNTPTPTLTPTPAPLYGFTFDDNGASLAAWGGPFYGTDSNDGAVYGQCVPGQIPEQCNYTTIPHGSPGNSLRLYTDGLYKFKASSPNNVSPNNVLPNDYDLYVDMSPWLIWPNAPCPYGGCGDGQWYGIIFNASGGTFGTNMSNFAYNGKYYRVYFYNVDAVKPIGIKLERCDGGSNAGSNNCHNLGSSPLPSNFIGNAGGFDTVHIVRLASGTIQVKVDGTVLITANDPNYTTGSGYGKYGVFIWSWDNNYSQAYEMQVDFDNIRVNPH